MDHARLKSFVDRIELLEEEQKALSSSKREIYANAKHDGYNAKALRKIIAERRTPDREQIEADMDAYRVALGMAVNDVANGATLREAAAKHGVSKSTLHRAVPRNENAQVGQSDVDLAVPDFLLRKSA